MVERSETEGTSSPPDGRKTWSSPEGIARHRAMTPQQRWRKAVQLSQVAQRLARAQRSDESAGGARRDSADER